MDKNEPPVQDGERQDFSELAAKPKACGKIDKFFGITASGSSYKREIIAGLTTFMAMVYILMVNADMFKLVIGGSDPYGAAYIATAIGAVAGTMLMALLAKMPLAQASGMGVNVFVVYTLLLGNVRGLTYANCMVLTLIDGLILVLLTAVGLRKKIFNAIPKVVRQAIPVGIGLFLTFVGLQQSGVIVNDARIVDGQLQSDTIVSFFSFNLFGPNSYGQMIAPLIALLGVIAIAILVKKNVKGAILWGILGSAACYYALMGIGCAFNDITCVNLFREIGETFSFNPFSAFEAWGKDAAGKVFYEGFDFTKYLSVEGNNVGTLLVLFATAALSLCMINIFDAFGTLYAACDKGNLLDKDGVPVRLERMLFADSIATCVGAVAGTSTISTVVESSSGVAAGGRTGFTALVTALSFLVAMFLSPIAKLVPRCATATALIWVGVIMMSSVTQIDWTDAADAIVAFLVFIVMLLGYSIVKGIGIGILACIIVKLCTGKRKELSVATYVIGALFLLTFLLT